MLFLLIFIVVSLAGFSGTWWLFVPLVFLMASWKADSVRHAFWSAFAATGLSWVIFILIKSLPNDNMLAGKVAQLFSLPHWIILFIISVIVGGLTSGLAAISGFFTARLFRKDTVKA